MPKSHFTSQEEKQIIQAIANAEKLTSGEIRVHVSHAEDQDVMARTQQIFNQLEMHKTKLRNAVLIHISISSRQFALCGDQGIHQKVGDDFWQTTRDKMLAQFKQGQIVEGICQGVLSIGQQLKIHFPISSQDTNELSNEISYD